MEPTELYHLENPTERLRAEGFDTVQDTHGREFPLEEVFGPEGDHDPLQEPYARQETIDPEEV